MSLSASGVLALTGLVAAGPAIWAGLQLADKLKRKQPVTGKAGEACEDVKQVEEIVEVELESGADRDPALAPRADHERQSTAAYTLILLGFAIGLGNVWRFPYLVGKYGGGAFVFAILICLCLLSCPIFLMEMGVGQYIGKNAIGCHRVIHPRWLGLAWGQTGLVFFLHSYYNCINAYTVQYVFSSCFSPLPWASDAPAFFEETVVNKQEGGIKANGLGSLQWNVVAALAVVWTVVFFSLAFGKKALAKVNWVCVVGPVFLLSILLARTATLPGAAEGVRFYMGKFDYTKLADIELWAQACGQILFSLGPGSGTTMTMSSYTRKGEDVFKICLIIAVCNSAFSIIGGFAIFGILGNLAMETNRDVADLAANSGPGLAFIAMAEGLTKFGSLSNIMSVLFFMMLLWLGLDSTFAATETLVSYLEDLCSSKRWAVRRWHIVVAVCATLFLCGLPYCTRNGIDLVDVIDHYGSSYFLLFSCFAEAIMFMMDFGMTRFIIALKLATFGNPSTPNGRDLPMPRFWHAAMYFFCPVMLGFLLVMAVVADVRKPYGDFPLWLRLLGWSVLVFCGGATLSTIFRRGETSLPPLADEEARLQERLKALESTPLSNVA
eukprot:TRINITY_DN31488_c0_g1_i1.p1 TRINITY_DN31488_c0_g1~~TRINITY_DN31488_c0_g1_i1.p1  ORF type:complete len:631 (+),score=81.14 TRINITY_DN31488_c0_g1_i1:72-1895(+)